MALDRRALLTVSLALPFAGAAAQMGSALIVNPYHVEETADALHRALTMPAAEQKERMSSMRMTVREFNVYRWAGRMLMEAVFLVSLQESSIQPPWSINQQEQLNFILGVMQLTGLLDYHRLSRMKGTLCWHLVFWLSHIVSKLYLIILLTTEGKKDSHR